MNFYEQLDKLCQRDGIRPTTLVESLGMSKGTMSNWKKGGIPNGEAVVRIAEHFNVTTDYLLRGISPEPSLTQDCKELLDLYHQLPERKQGELIGYAKRMLEEEFTSADNLEEKVN